MVEFRLPGRPHRHGRASGSLKAESHEDIYIVAQWARQGKLTSGEGRMQTDPPVFFPSISSCLALQAAFTAPSEPAGGFTLKLRCTPRQIVFPSMPDVWYNYHR